MLLGYLDISLGTAFTLAIDLFGLLIAFVLVHYAAGNRYNTLSNKYLVTALGSLIVVIALEFVTWLFDGMEGDWVAPFLLVMYTLYCWFEVLTVVLWARFIAFCVTGSKLLPQPRFFMIELPMALTTLLLIVNLFTGIDFVLDANNAYQSQVFDYVVIVALIVYLNTVAVWVLVRRMREKLYVRRRFFVSLTYLSSLPTIGFIVQLVSAEISVTWVGAVVAALIVYISQTESAVSRDLLTGLNNRGSLDSYLNERLFSGKEQQGVFILMDMDDFKSINDNFGHDEGDEALRAAAEAMRGAVEGTNAFIARYGGDEFAAILPGGDAQDAEAFIGRVRYLMDETNRRRAAQGDRCPRLAVSMGYELLTDSDAYTVEELIHAADQNMYADKRARKAASPSR